MSTSDQNPPNAPSSRNVGDTLAGCYALSRRLEVSDGVEVWLAHDEVLGKDVSLHFVPEAIGKDSKALQELRLDIKKNRQLIHPNILRVYDLVEEPEWVAVSMDAFEGESLGRQVGRGALPISQIRPWATQLATTLEEAHKIGVLHRDLSPASLFLTGSGKLLVANFGISRTIHEAQARAGVAGTDAFTSPQLKEGKATTRADDIYSIGAILFTAITGGAPSSSTDVPAALSAAHAPDSWSAIVAACLQPNPESRPQTAAELARQLAAATDEPAASAPAPAPATAGEVAPAAAAATAVVAAAAAPVVEATPPPPPAPVPPVAEEPPAPASAPTPIPELELSTPAPAPVVSEPAPAPAPVETKPPVPVEIEPAPAAAEIVPPAPQPVELAPAPATPKPEPVISEPVLAPASPISPSPEPLVELKPAAPAAAPAPAPESSKAEPVKPESAKSEPAKPAAEASPASTTRPWELPAKEPKKTDIPRPSAPTGPSKGPDRSALGERSQHPLYPEESKFPVTTLAAAAAIIVVVAIIYHFTKSGKDIAATPADQQPEKTELRSLPPATPPPATTPAPDDGPKIETKQPKEVAKVPATPTPAPKVAPDLANKAIVDRSATLQKARTDAEAAGKTYAALQKQQQEAEASVAEIQKSISEKSASIKTVKKAADEAAAQRKKLEDDKKVAEAAALEAQKAAAEKTRLAEISAKALLDMEKANADKLSGPEQAEKEIADLQKSLEEKQRAVADGTKALAQAQAALQAQETAVAEHQREIDRIKASEADAQKQKEAPVAAVPGSASSPEQGKIDGELQRMKEDFQKKMAELEAKKKQLDSPAPATPAPVITGRATPAPLPATPAPATPAAMAMLTPPSTPIKLVPSATPSVVIPEATPQSTSAVPAAGGNSLGQKFVPVGDVDFCIWQTRVKDFEVFAKAVNLRSNSWKGPGFKQGVDHPVVNVSWNEAVAFCKWLTDKEHKENTLPANQFYRLPTDLEWSRAVGLPEESGKTPEMRDMGVPDVYPWGTAWPPPAGAGNYTGEETGSDVAIKGYDDGFAWTSPVGSFPPNKFGIYDMGGNVWQWCMDTWNSESKAKVLRGASWYNGALKLSLLSSCRVHAAPDSSTDNYGFRIVRAKEGAAARK